MNKKALLIPLVAFMALFALRMGQIHSQANPNTLLLSGNIEVTEVELSFKIPGKVEKRFVSEGETVSQGQQVALMDTSELVHEVALKQSEVEAAKAALDELKTGYLPEEIAQAEAQLKQANANLTNLSTDFNRQQTLFEGDVISSKEFDVSRSAYEIAKAKVTESQEKLSLMKKGIRQEKIAQAEANFHHAQHAVALAETRLGYATIASPISGYILSDNIESGEFVAPGTPVVTIGNLKDVWLRGYIDESDLGKIKIGQKVKVTSDSYPKKVYEGTVTFISPEAEFTPKNVQTEKERVKLVYRVKVDIPNPDLELKPGMPVDGIILLNQK